MRWTILALALLVPHSERMCYAADFFENTNGIGPVRGVKEGNATATVRRSGDDVGEVSVALNGKNSDSSGTVRYVAYVLAINADGEVVWKSGDTTVTIGADPFKSVKKDASNSFEIPADKYREVVDVVLFADRSKSSGFGIDGLIERFEVATSLFDIRIEDNDWFNINNPAETLKDLAESADPSQIGSNLRAIGSRFRLGGVLRKLTPKELGEVLGSVDFGVLEDTLGRLLPDDLGPVLESLTPDSLENTLTKLDGEFLRETLERVPTPNLKQLISNIETMGWEKLLPNNIPWDWKELDPSQIKWEQLDPSKIPWEKVDPSNVKWESVDPSPAFLDAAEKLEGTPFVGDALIEMKKLGEALPTKVGPELLEEGRKAIERRAADLEVAVRTEVGRAVDEVKKHPLYKQLQDLLSSLTRVVVLDFKTNAEFEYSFDSGTYNLDVETLPGVKVTETTIESGTLPDVEPLEVAFSATKSTLLKYTHTNNYKDVEEDVVAELKLAPADYRVVSERFVNWFNPTNAVEKTVLAILSGDPKTPLNRTVKIAEFEVDQIWSWVKRRADAATNVEDVVTVELLLAVLEGDAASVVPELDVRPLTIKHEDKFALVGVAKDAVKVINEISRQLGLKSVLGNLAKNEWAGTLLDKGGEFQTDFRVVTESPGYVLVWKNRSPSTPIDPKVWAEQLVVRANPDAEFGTKNDLLLTAVEKLAKKDDSTFGKIASRALEVFRDVNAAQNLSNVANSKLPERMLGVIGLTAEDIRRRQVDPSDVRIDLTGSSVGVEMEKQLKDFAIGNEAIATVNKIEFDLSTQTVSMNATLIHRHAWNLEGIVGGVLKSVGIDFDKYFERKRKTNPTIVAQEPDSNVAAESDSLAQDRDASSMERVGTSTIASSLRWHFLESGGIRTVGDSQVAGRVPVVFVPGALTSRDQAAAFAESLSQRLGRPVLHVLNESVVDTAAGSGTPGFPTDLAEYVYDATWPTAVTRYLARSDIQSLAATTVEKKGAVPRLQLNPTTRHLAALLEEFEGQVEEFEGQVDVVTHANGGVCLRNAVIALQLLDEEETVSRRISWVSLGNPLLPHEYGFTSAKYVSLWTPQDKIRDYLLASVDGENVPDVADLMPSVSAGTMASYLPTLVGDIFRVPTGFNVETGYDGGDLDGDGIDEAISSCRVDRVVTRVLANSWDGAKFTTAPTAVVDQPFGDARGNLFVRDANGDGFDDLVLLEASRAIGQDVFQDGHLLVRLNNGAGGFDELVSTRQFLRPDDAGWDDREELLVVGRFSGRTDASERPLLEIGAVRPKQRMVILTPLASKMGRRSLGDSLPTTIRLRPGRISHVGSANVSGSSFDEIVVSGAYCVQTKKRLFHKAKAKWCRYADVFSLGFGSTNWSRVCQITCAPMSSIVFGNWDGDSLDDLSYLQASRSKSSSGESLWSPYRNVGQRATCCYFKVIRSGASRLPDPCKFEIQVGL